MSKESAAWRLVVVVMATELREFVHSGGLPRRVRAEGCSSAPWQERKLAISTSELPRMSAQEVHESFYPVEGAME